MVFRVNIVALQKTYHKTIATIMAFQHDDEPCWSLPLNQVISISVIIITTTMLVVKCDTSYINQTIIIVEIMKR